MQFQEKWIWSNERVRHKKPFEHQLGSTQQNPKIELKVKQLPGLKNWVTAKFSHALTSAENFPYEDAENFELVGNFVNM